MDQTQGMAVAALIDGSRLITLGIVLRTSRAAGMFVRTDARCPHRPCLCGRHHNRLGRESMKFTAVRLMFPFVSRAPWRRWGTKDGSLPAAIAAHLGLAIVQICSVGNGVTNVHASAFDLQRQFTCLRVHDDDRRRRVFLFYSAGKPNCVADITKLIAKNSVDSNLVGTFNELHRVQVHRRGSGWENLRG